MNKTEATVIVAGPVLAISLAGLKLAGVLDWSWLVVSIPIWPITMICLLLLVGSFYIRWADNN